MVAPAVAFNQGPCPLDANDLERVIAIDRAHTGHARRHFFEKRFAAARKRPEDFVQIGVMRGGALRGFLIARVLHGEFGREEDVAVLDAVGVDTESQDRGIGHTLMDELITTLRQKGVRSLHSQAKWVNHDLLRFFETSGFELAPRFILERPVAERLSEEIDEP